MPVKPLPKGLIQRLRKVVRKGIKVYGITKVDSSLERMKSVDHRKWIKQQFGFSLEHNRVRQMNVSRNFPEIGLVIKKMHYPDELARLRRMVRLHNKRKNAGKLSYELRMPFAYSLSNGFVAMAKTSKPSLAEVLFSFKDDGTHRGKSFFRTLKLKYGVTRAQLQEAARQASNLTKLHYGNILLLGVNAKGKFIFMPLVDLY